MQGTFFHIGSVGLGKNGGDNAEYLREASETADTVDPDAVIQTGPLFSRKDVNEELSGHLSRALEPLGDTPLYTLTDPSTIKSHLNGDEAFSELDIRHLSTSPRYIHESNEMALYGVTTQNGDDVFSVLSDLEDSEDGCYNVLCFDSRLSPIAPTSEVNGRRVLLECNMRLDSVDALFCGGSSEAVSGKIKQTEVFYPGPVAPSSEDQDPDESDYGMNSYEIKSGESDIQPTRVGIEYSPGSESESGPEPKLEVKKRLRGSPQQFRETVEEDPDAYLGDFESILRLATGGNEATSVAASESVAIISKQCTREVSEHTDEVISVLEDAERKPKENLVRAVGHLSTN
jgi:hypothetical protein